MPTETYKSAEPELKSKALEEPHFETVKEPHQSKDEKT